MKIFDFYRNGEPPRFVRRLERPVVRFADFCGRHRGWTLWLLLILGTALRIGYIGMVDHIGRDERTYVACIEHAAANGFETLPPNAQRLMVYSGMWLKKAGVKPVAGMRIFNIASSVLWLVTVFFLGCAVFHSSGAGSVCLALAAFEPVTIRISGMILREPLHLLLFTFALLCAVRIVRGARLRLFCALLGVVSALAAWSRLEGWEMIYWMPLALGFYVFGNGRRELRARRTALTGALLYLGALSVSWLLIFSASPDYFRGISLKTQAIIRRWGK